MKMLQYIMIMIISVSFGNLLLGTPYFFEGLLCCDHGSHSDHAKWNLRVKSYSEICGALGTTFFHP